MGSENPLQEPPGQPQEEEGEDQLGVEQDNVQPRAAAVGELHPWGG